MEATIHFGEPATQSRLQYQLCLNRPHQYTAIFLRLFHPKDALQLESQSRPSQYVRSSVCLESLRLTTQSLESNLLNTAQHFGQKIANESYAVHWCLLGVAICLTSPTQEPWWSLSLIRFDS